MIYNFAYNGRLYCFNENCQHHGGTYTCPLMIMEYFACEDKIGLEYELVKN